MAGMRQRSGSDSASVRSIFIHKSSVNSKSGCLCPSRVASLNRGELVSWNWSCTSSPGHCCCFRYSSDNTGYGCI